MSELQTPRVMNADSVMASARAYSTLEVDGLVILSPSENKGFPERALLEAIEYHSRSGIDGILVNTRHTPAPASLLRDRKGPYALASASRETGCKLAFLRPRNGLIEKVMGVLVAKFGGHVMTTADPRQALAWLRQPVQLAAVAPE